MKKIFFSLFLFAVHSLSAVSLSQDIDRSARVVDEFVGVGIPQQVFRNAKGVAVLSIVKAGFIFSGKLGSGLVVAKTSKGWSAPSAIGLGGAGFGYQIGLSITDFVFVLNTQAAVNAFASNANLTLGVDIGVAAGPVGGMATGGVTAFAPIYAYSRSKGVFAGVSVEGAVILQRGGANAQFYGRSITAHELLYGGMPPPKRADPLYRALDKR